MQRVAPPRFIRPMLAKLVLQLPAGPDWLYELKWDGFRAQLSKYGDAVSLRSRNDNDLGSDFPSILQAAEGLKARSALLDGELVALDKSGKPSFQLLQPRAKRAALVFYAFDLLELNGKPLTALPLELRRSKLQPILRGDVIRFSESLEGDPLAIIAGIADLGLEGVLAKRRTSSYRPGQKNGDWVKFKVGAEQEFVVGGYRATGTRIDALVVGCYVDQGLRYSSIVKQGYTPTNRAQLWQVLHPLETSECPFVDLPTPKKGRFGEGITKDKMSEFRWVDPVTVVQVSFASWTAHFHLRHSIFKGIRRDKPAKDVTRETP